jgi:D-serine deaminase-like pyridoxal phosphate-dependent protein
LLDPGAPALLAVPTPALVIDASALDSNIARMAAAARRDGQALRPHAKTHKSPAVARRQLQAGALGIACATILEAEGLAEAGVDHLLITSPVVGPEKVARLAQLHRRSPLIVVADHPAQVDAIVAALTPQDAPLDVLVDVDVGQARTGVASIETGVALARHVHAQARVRFAGLQGYAGHVQHIVEASERRRAAAEAGNLVHALIARLNEEGLAPAIVSGGGTGTSGFDLRSGPYTELQVGSYVFMDADYGSIREPDGSRLPYENALFVLATVISANRPGQVTVDAGTKGLEVNGPMPDRFVGVPPGSSYAFAGDEHGTIRLPVRAPQPPLGARILIGATHCDPTVNLHAAYHAVTGEDTLAVWPIVGRYEPLGSDAAASS